MHKCNETIKIVFGQTVARKYKRRREYNFFMASSFRSSCPRFSYKGKSEDGLQNKEDVERWLRDKKKEFEFVCSLAEIDPARARKEFIRYKEGEYDRNKKNLRLSKRRSDIS